MKKDMPIPIIVVSLLLLLDAITVLAVCLLDKAQEGALYTLLGSIVVIVTSILVLLNHKWALPFVFVTACLLSIDLFRERAPLHVVPLSLLELRQTFRLLFNVALYWGLFLWYRQWRRGSLGDRSL